MRKKEPPAVITPPPRMLEYFLLTGRWPLLKFMAMLTDKREEVEDGPSNGPTGSKR